MNVLTACFKGVWYRDMYVLVHRTLTIIKCEVRRVFVHSYGE